MAILKIDSAFTPYNGNNCLIVWLLQLLPCASSHTKALYLPFYIPLTTWQSLLWGGHVLFHPATRLQQEYLLPRNIEGHKTPVCHRPEEVPLPAQNNPGMIVCSQLTSWFTQGSPGCSVKGDGVSSLEESSPCMAPLQRSIQTPTSHVAY